jgi:ketosteroid isomerase-like protein
MRRTSLLTTIVFVAGLGIGYFARTPMSKLPRRDTYAADLAAIEKLRQKDIEVTLSQDPQGLIDIWTEDAVRFISGKPPVVGKQAIGADNEKGRAANPGFKVLSYAPKFKNIQIEDGLACEWFESEAKFKLSPEGTPESWHGTGLRVMMRQSDGSWKMALTIWIVISVFEVHLVCRKRDIRVGLRSRQAPTGSSSYTILTRARSPGFRSPDF